MERATPMGDVGFFTRIRQRLSGIALRPTVEVPAEPTATVSFTTIHDITTQLREKPDQPELHDSLEQCAAALAEALTVERPTIPPRDLGLGQVWDALHAYSINPTDATFDLAAIALNRFGGEGQPALCHALTLAKQKEMPVHEALDRVLESNELSAA